MLGCLPRGTQPLWALRGPEVRLVFELHARGFKRCARMKHWVHQHSKCQMVKAKGQG